MQMIIDYIKEYRILVSIFLLVLILFFFVASRAGKAVSRTKAEKEKLIKKLDRLKFLRENYSDLTEEKILSDSGENLLNGVADNIQQRLEKNDDMNAAFETINEEEKLVYAFYYFLDESEKGVSEFFRSYTKPLAPCALTACEAFFEKELYELIKEEYLCFDEDDEAHSVIKEETAKLDEKIKSLLDVDKAKMNAAEYIKKNVSKFI